MKNNNLIEALIMIIALGLFFSMIMGGCEMEGHWSSTPNSSLPPSEERERKILIHGMEPFNIDDETIGVHYGQRCGRQPFTGPMAAFPRDFYQFIIEFPPPYRDSVDVIIKQPGPCGKFVLRDRIRVRDNGIAIVAIDLERVPFLEFSVISQGVFWRVERP